MGREVVIKFSKGTVSSPVDGSFSFGEGTLTYELADPIDPRQQIAQEIADHLMKGKGEERHGRGMEFTDQPWVYLSRTYPGFLQGQAAKKIDESMGMDKERAAKELVSAAGYLILAVLKLRGEVK